MPISQQKYILYIQWNKSYPFEWLQRFGYLSHDFGSTERRWNNFKSNHSESLKHDYAGSRRLKNFKSSDLSNKYTINIA